MAEPITTSPMIAKLCEYAPKAMWGEQTYEDGSVGYAAALDGYLVSFTLDADTAAAINARDPKLAWPDVRKIAKTLQRDLWLKVIRGPKQEREAEQPAFKKINGVDGYYGPDIPADAEEVE